MDPHMRLRPRSNSIEVIFNTKSAPSMSPTGRRIPFGVQGTYLSVDPSPEYWLKLRTPRTGSPDPKHFVELRASGGTKLYLAVSDACAKLGVSEPTLREMVASVDWATKLQARIQKVKGCQLRYRKLRRGADRSSKEYSHASIGKIWESGLSDKDMMAIVHDADSLSVEETRVYRTGSDEFTYYKTRHGSLRVFKVEEELLNRPEASVRSGAELCSVSQQVLKLVPSSIQSQVDSLRNGYRVLSALHEDGYAWHIQALPTEPRQLLDAGYWAHYCRLYNQHDLFDLCRRPDSAWWELPVKERLRLCGTLLRALACVHQPRKNDRTGQQDRLRHGDIKLDNIFAECRDNEWMLVLGDFDGARWLSEARKELDARRLHVDGTRQIDVWVCEAMYGIATYSCLHAQDARVQLSLLQQRKYDEFLEVELARDVWQLGAAFLECLTGSIFGFVDDPCQSAGPLEVDATTLAEARLILTDEGVPHALIEVILNMYAVDWRERKSASALVDWWEAAMLHVYGKESL